MSDKLDGKIDFNINDYVLVKLTDTGRAELKRQADELRRDFPRLKSEYTPPKEDEDGYSRWQMWSLMSTFGHITGNGFSVPFDTSIKIIT